MAAWRKMEDELLAALDAAGFDTKREDGNFYAVLASLDCNAPHDCKAVIGPYGKVECLKCENEENLNGKLTTLDITKLARRLADI